CLAAACGPGPVAGGTRLVALGVGVVIGNAATGWLADTAGRFWTVALLGVLARAANLVLAAAPPGVPAVALGAVYVALGSSGAFIAVLLAHVREVAPPAAVRRAIPPAHLSR